MRLHMQGNMGCGASQHEAAAVPVKKEMVAITPSGEQVHTPCAHVDMQVVGSL